MYTTVFNPTAEKYKRVVLDNPRMLRSNHGFFQDPKNSDALIAPPRLVDESIRSGDELSNKHHILRIEEIDNPEDYPEYLAMRIRGEVPLAAKYADELTRFDPRFHRSANTILLSPDHIPPEDIGERLKEDDHPLIFGYLASLDKVKEMGETELFDTTYEGGKWFPGFPKLLTVGEELEVEFDGVEARYGGSFFLPNETYPHGTFEVTDIYAWMETFDEETFERLCDWMEDKLVDVNPDIESPDEFDKVSAANDDNEMGISYVRAWWD